MASHSDALIKELLALDPSLAKHRGELKELLATLLEAKPNAEPSKAFQRELLLKLRAKMKAQTEDAPPYFFPFSLMINRYLFAGGGVFVGALLMLAVFTVPDMIPAPKTSNSNSIAMQKEPEAFGSLSVYQESTAPGRGGGGMTRLESGGGGGGVPDMANSMMIAPDSYTQTRYSFDGSFELPSEDVEVFKRVRPSSKPSINTVAKGFAQTMIDWNAFRDLNVTHVNFMQNGDSGYNISIDFNEGMVSLYRIFGPSERPEFNCRDEACFERYRLRESDMLSDAEAIRIAQNFIREFDIDVSQYGEPVMQDEWRVWYARTEDKSSFYFPEQMNVMFPMLINGKPVYEEYGGVYGLNMSIDIRTETVSGMYNYALQNFEGSAYAPLTDMEQARRHIEVGTLYSWEDPSAKKVYATLGEPEEVYMHYSMWDEQGRTSKELFVPALAFPVVENSENEFDNRERVLLPLAKDIFPKQEDLPRPLPLPMPVDDPRVMIEE